MYRVTSCASQPVVQTPQRAVSGLILYSQLIEAPDRAEAIAELFGDSVGIADEQSALVKLWAEMVYEEVRLDIRPDLPSRLESVFACVDMLEAFAFAYRTGRGGQICRGRTAPGAPWCIVNMAGFTPERPKPATPDGFRAAQGTLQERAAAYWCSGDQLEHAEVLVAGEVTLDGPPLDLVDLLHHLGVTVADDRTGRGALTRAN